MNISHRQIHLMGTVIDLIIHAPQADTLMDSAESLLHTYNMRFSANDPKSELAQINQQAGITPVATHPELFHLIAKGKAHSNHPIGNLNIAIGPIVQSWRIGFADATRPDHECIAEKLALTNPQDIILDDQHLTVFLAKKGMRIDLGALAKGYIADEIIAFLKEKGASAAMINLGGNVLSFGNNPNRANGFWHIGIQHPYQPRGQFITITPVKNCSVVTSGVYERTLTIGEQTFHHIFDKSTGYPITSAMQSLTIYAKSSLDCEIWTTQLFGLPIQDVLNTVEALNGIECLIVTNALDILTSKGIA